ncbi:MAG: molybdopterin-dependent oxidoreductase, partial [Burkholderiaceae bacterium]|nr:molybdopterin-dependent oxidoreductase [Burkholderiaceae bacterium]
LEELGLLRRVVNGLGSENIDFRLRQSDFTLESKVTPWLGMSIADFAQLKNIFVIGSFLRKDHPLLASRVRQAVKSGAKLSFLHASDDDLLIKISNKAVMAPSMWLKFLAEIAAAIAEQKEINKPVGCEDILVSAVAKNIALSLLSGGSGVFLGNTAAQHPQAAQLHHFAQWIAQHSGAGFGYLTESANTVGAYLTGTIASNLTDKGILEQNKKAYVVLHAEPEFDCADPLGAKKSLSQAEMVVMMSPYKHGFDYADVLLPISPFSETSGTFINCEGRVQSFYGVVKPLGDTRPGWKVLRVLGNLLELSNFEFESSEAVRDELLGSGIEDVSSRLSNFSNIAPVFNPEFTSATQNGLERLSDVPIYRTDGIVRRAPSLQKTADAKTPEIGLSFAQFTRLGISDGDFVRLKQGSSTIVLPASLHKNLPENVVRIPAAHTETGVLGAMFGIIELERA